MAVNAEMISGFAKFLRRAAATEFKSSCGTLEVFFKNPSNYQLENLTPIADCLAAAVETFLTKRAGCSIEAELKEEYKWGCASLLNAVIKFEKCFVEKPIREQIASIYEGFDYSDGASAFRAASEKSNSNIPLRTPTKTPTAVVKAPRGRPPGMRLSQVLQQSPNSVSKRKEGHDSPTGTDINSRGVVSPALSAGSIFRYSETCGSPSPTMLHAAIHPIDQNVLNVLPYIPETPPRKAAETLQFSPQMASQGTTSSLIPKGRRIGKASSSPNTMSPPTQVTHHRQSVKKPEMFRTVHPRDVKMGGPMLDYGFQAAPECGTPSFATGLPIAPGQQTMDVGSLTDKPNLRSLADSPGTCPSCFSDESENDTVEQILGPANLSQSSRIDSAFPRPSVVSSSLSIPEGSSESALRDEVHLPRRRPLFRGYTEHLTTELAIEDAYVPLDMSDEILKHSHADSNIDEGNFHSPLPLGNFKAIADSIIEDIDTSQDNHYLQSSTLALEPGYPRASSLFSVGSDVGKRLPPVDLGPNSMPSAETVMKEDTNLDEPEEGRKKTDGCTTTAVVFSSSSGSESEEDLYVNEKMPTVNNKCERKKPQTDDATAIQTEQAPSSEENAATTSVQVYAVASRPTSAQLESHVQETHDVEMTTVPGSLHSQAPSPNPPADLAQRREVTPAVDVESDAGNPSAVESNTASVQPPSTSSITEPSITKSVEIDNIPGPHCQPGDEEDIEMGEIESKKSSETPDQMHPSRRLQLQVGDKTSWSVDVQERFNGIYAAANSKPAYPASAKNNMILDEPADDEKVTYHQILEEAAAKELYGHTLVEKVTTSHPVAGKSVKTIADNEKQSYFLRCGGETGGKIDLNFEISEVTFAKINGFVYGANNIAGKDYLCATFMCHKTEDVDFELRHPEIIIEHMRRVTSWPNVEQHGLVLASINDGHLFEAAPPRYETALLPFVDISRRIKSGSNTLTLFHSRLLVGYTFSVRIHAPTDVQEEAATAARKELMAWTFLRRVANGRLPPRLRVSTR